MVLRFSSSSPLLRLILFFFMFTRPILGFDRNSQTRGGSSMAKTTNRRRADGNTEEGTGGFMRSTQPSDDETVLTKTQPVCTRFSFLFFFFMCLTPETSSTSNTSKIFHNHTGYTSLRLGLSTHSSSLIGFVHDPSTLAPAAPGCRTRPRM